jgi:hypothetical protein
MRTLRRTLYALEVTEIFDCSLASGGFPSSHNVFQTSTVTYVCWSVSGLVVDIIVEDEVSPV